jgi:hypothetical protein
MNGKPASSGITVLGNDVQRLFVQLIVVQATAIAM